jgi:hypothetical protein
MQLSILEDTRSAPADQRRSIDISQFKAGDRLEARIVQIASSGRTVLQFSEFRAVVDRLVGGREGDVIQFEVLPDEKPTSRNEHGHRAITKQLNTPTGTRGSNGGQLNSKIVRLNTLPETGVRRPNAKGPPLSAPKPISQAPPFTISTATQTTLSTHAIEIVSTWFRRFRKDRQFLERFGKGRSPALNKSEFAKEELPAKPTERSRMFESERVDRPRASQTVVGYNEFHLGNWPVRMKIYGKPPGNHADKHRLFLKAVFLLNLEHTGAVRTDIQMGENQIRVGFFVESENSRANFEKALPELTAALSPLGKHCYCHVTVSPPKIHEFLKKDEGPLEDARFDIRA